MPKVRVSHFITKNISISKENSSSFINKPSDKKEITSPKNEKIIQQSSGKATFTQSSSRKVSARQKEILLTSAEAKYATIPRKQNSRIIQNEILQESALFRDISNQKRIVPSCLKRNEERFEASSLVHLTS